MNKSRTFAIKEKGYLSISLTVIPPRGFHVYMIQFCLAYYLNLLQIAEKQTKVEVAQKLTIILPCSFHVYIIKFCLLSFVTCYLNLLQIAEKQTKFEVAQKRWSRQNLIHNIKNNLLYLQTAITKKVTSKCKKFLT